MLSNYTVSKFKIIGFGGCGHVTKASTDSDPFPVKRNCRFAFKIRDHARPPPPKPKYHECKEEETTKIITQIKSEMRCQERHR